MRFAAQGACRRAHCNDARRTIAPPRGGCVDSSHARKRATRARGEKLQLWLRTSRPFADASVPTPAKRLVRSAPCSTNRSSATPSGSGSTAFLCDRDRGSRPDRGVISGRDRAPHASPRAGFFHNPRVGIGKYDLEFAREIIRVSIDLVQDQLRREPRVFRRRGPGQASAEAAPTGAA